MKYIRSILSPQTDEEDDEFPELPHDLKKLIRE
jgi:hypothetical protein